MPHPYDPFSCSPILVWGYRWPRSSACGQVPAAWLATGPVWVDDGAGVAGETPGVGVQALRAVCGVRACPAA